MNNYDELLNLVKNFIKDKNIDLETAYDMVGGLRGEFGTILTNESLLKEWNTKTDAE